MNEGLQYSPSSSSSTRHPKPSSQPSPSSDFGAFTSAPLLSYPSHTLQAPSPSGCHDPARGQTRSPSLLDNDNLFGSYDHQEPYYLAAVASSQTHSKSPTPQLKDIDLLGGDIWEDATPQSRTPSPKAPPSSPRHRGSPTPNSPIHVNLPPRPVDISAEYIPPLRSPRRMSTPFFTSSLGSPPILTDAGNDIIFHPSHEARNDNAADEMRRVQKGDPATSASSSTQIPPQRSQSHRSSTRSPTQPSKLLDTLATTTKMASKWRSAITSSSFTPPTTLPTLEAHHSSAPKSSDSLPIDISHSNPFATPEQLAGSYKAPTGAPGFDAHRKVPSRNVDQDEEWGSIALLGRRDSTAPILTPKDAEQLRRFLPPRQRLSGAWTLLFSLDQHGASLSTLYRLVDRYGQAHRSCGNILIVIDGKGNRFGVFLNESIVKREGTYYGSGESFLFKITSLSAVQAFRWTGKNQYFALCESDLISFGGGDGTYGLLLDSTFSRNSSATCPAYENDILSESNNRKSSQASLFDCVGLEVWGT
ncbi:uncharacterized protein IL334_005898 [Kwoniella shivajii]|uniref:Oxidation resistance protein 1 n=1 Tax=Kwoniella shivajii TaxID=564305 RepID=A0ABZ1D7H9_9TREE|nr:hypothetical protein IL334_005898 [Kwoniella shivajii]